VSCSCETTYGPTRSTATGTQTLMDTSGQRGLRSGMQSNGEAARSRLLRAVLKTSAKTMARRGGAADV
jgi:hypothetical protein